MRSYYHLIGIGGIGMGTLASLLLAKGYKVSGSDIKENELTAQLRKEGAIITIGHHAENIAKPDYVVYSSAIRVNNPELFESVSRNIPLLKRAQVLARLVNEQIGVTVAGAHGKTTTTSMASYLLINAGLSPTTAVGGIINNGGASYNANLGEGKYFVAEVDESDGTFLYFHPQCSIVTNIDYEHVDFYKNWEGILEAWQKFIACTAPGGRVFACGEDDRLTAMVRQSGVDACLYGFGRNHDVYAKNIQSKGFVSSFECWTKEGKFGDFCLSVPGRHNILNALACIALGMHLNIGVEVIAKTLKEFTGVKRRFQLKGDEDGIMVVDDYGHHPTEISATISSARLFAPKRLVTVFQPHRYSRTKFLLEEFIGCLKGTDELVLTDVYAASERVSEGISSNVLFERIKKVMGSRAVFLPKKSIVEHLKGIVKGGDMVLFLGAGDIYHLSDELVKVLQARSVTHAGKMI